MSFRNRILPVFLVTVVWSIVWYLVELEAPSPPAGSFPSETGLRAETGTRSRFSGHPPYYQWLLGVAGIVGTAAVLARIRRAPASIDTPAASPETSWRTLFECTSEAMVLSQPDGTYLAANRAACAILHMTEEEIKTLGRTLMVPPPEVDLPALLKHRAATGAVEGEIQLRRKDGSLVNVEGSSNQITLEDGRTQVITVFREIAHRKSEREAMLGQARRWQTAIEASGDGLWDWNLDTHEVYFSDTWKRMLGYGPDEIPAHVDEWKARIHPDDQERVFEAVRRHLARETDTYRCEHRVRCKDSSYKWILDCGSVIDRAPDGRPRRMIGTHKDLTESRAIQQKLAESEEKFHQAFHHAPLIMVVTNLSDGRILEANAWAQKVSGIDPAEGLGRSVVELGWFTEADRMELVGLLHSQGRVIDLEMTGRSRAGAVVNCLVNCQLVVIGGEQRVITTLQDITSRKRADEELQESRKNYLGMFNTVSEAIYVHDENGVFFDVNAGASAMYGRAREELIGETLVSLSADEKNDLARLKTTNAEVYATGHPVAFEFWGRRQDGGIFPQSCVTHRGKYFGKDVLITTARDITAQRCAEEALVRSELRFRTLFHYSPFGAMEEDFSSVKARLDLLRAQGITDLRAHLASHPDEVSELAGMVRILTVNERASTLFGIPHDQPEQFILTAKLSPESYPVFADELVALSEGRTSFHAELIGLDERNRPINLDLTLTVQPGHEETLDRVLVSFIDITERKRAEARIVEQAALLDVTHDAILVLDLNQTVTYWNRGAERLYGLSRDETLGHRYESLVYRETPANSGEAWKQLIDKSESSGERRHATKTRGEIVVQERATLVRDASGAPKSVLLVITDITESKRLETQFLRAQRLESLGSLASGLAHDLNNVLTPIIMSCDYLAETSSSAHDRELIEVLGGSARRGAEIVQQLLLYGRGSNTPRAPMDLRRVIKDMMQIMRETFPKDIEATFEVDPNLWTIDGDRTQLHQVLLNLCVNARDAMPGGGRLLIRADNQPATPEFVSRHPDDKPGTYVVLQVRDTGAGIAPDHLDRIFDPFYTTKPVGQGTGLGLASVLGIVRGHGGFISVSSAVGIGTEFSVHLPARTHEPDPGVDSPAQASPDGDNELILVIDDEASIRTTLLNALQRHGYRVVSAATGSEGVDLLQRHAKEVRLVITDIMMPGMDGIATIRSLRANEPQLPVVAMSGVPHQRAELEASFGPHLRFLQKPFAVDTILATLRELLHQKSAPPRSPTDLSCW